MTTAIANPSPVHVKSGGSNTVVQMNSDLPFGDFLDPFAVTEIVSSKTYRDGEWRRLTNLRGFTKGVDKVVLPVDISRFRIMVVTSVAPGTHVKLHRHDDEPIFRYVTDGKLRLNDVDYEAGDWVLVPVGFPYEITTQEGYTTVAGYGVACTG